MSQDYHGHEIKEPVGWLDKPNAVRRFFLAIYLICGALLAAEFLLFDRLAEHVEVEQPHRVASMDHSTGAVRVARVKGVPGHRDFQPTERLEKVLVLPDLPIAFRATQSDIDRTLYGVDGRVDLDVVLGESLLEVAQEPEIGLLPGEVDPDRAKPELLQEYHVVIRE